MIKIDFEITDGVHTYKDALHLEDDNQFTESEIEQMKQDRFNRWVTVITSIPEPIIEAVPTDVVTDSGV